MLDSLVSGVSYLFGGVSDTFLDNPWLFVVLAVVLFLLLKKRR